jgi:hypothetical protein
VPGVGYHGEGAILAVGVVVGAWAVNGGLLALAWAKGEGGANSVTIGSVKRPLYAGEGAAFAVCEGGEGGSGRRVLYRVQDVVRGGHDELDKGGDGHLDVLGNQVWNSTERIPQTWNSSTAVFAKRANSGYIPKKKRKLENNNLSPLPYLSIEKQEATSRLSWGRLVAKIEAPKGGIWTRDWVFLDESWEILVSNL